MIRKLAFQNLHITEPSIEERKHARDECNEVIGFYQSLIKFFGILHLFVAGAALAYIVILCSDNDFSIWFSVFARISLPSDILFYIFTFFIFVTNFVFAAIFYQLKSPRVMEKILLTISAGLLLLSLFITTFTLPMSYMIHQSIDDYDDWYTSKLVDGGMTSLFQTTYKNLAIARMVLIIIPGFIFPTFVSRSCYFIFQDLFHSRPV